MKNGCTKNVYIHIVIIIIRVRISVYKHMHSKHSCTTKNLQYHTHARSNFNLTYHSIFTLICALCISTKCTNLLLNMCANNIVNVEWIVRKQPNHALFGEIFRSHVFILSTQLVVLQYYLRTQIII